jgi:hypothetical protein
VRFRGTDPNPGETCEILILLSGNVPFERPGSFSLINPYPTETVNAGALACRSRPGNPRVSLIPRCGGLLAARNPPNPTSHNAHTLCYRLDTTPGYWAWYDAIGAFNSLGAAYSLLATIALVQIIRIHLRVPEYGWTTQKVFFLLNFLVCAQRAAVFFFRAPIQFLDPLAQDVLLDLPGT